MILVCPQINQNHYDYVSWAHPNLGWAVDVQHKLIGHSASWTSISQDSWRPRLPLSSLGCVRWRLEDQFLLAFAFECLRCSSRLGTVDVWCILLCVKDKWTHTHWTEGEALVCCCMFCCWVNDSCCESRFLSLRRVFVKVFQGLECSKGIESCKVTRWTHPELENWYSLWAHKC